MLQALSVLALALGLAAIPFGIYLLRASRLPGWMKGIWKWPLGDNVTPATIHLMGWSGVLVGLSAVLAFTAVWSPRVPSILVGLIAMFFAGASTFAWAWSVAISRSH